MKGINRPRLYLEECQNPVIEDMRVLIDLVAILNQESRPPWNSFYFLVFFTANTREIKATQYDDLTKNYYGVRKRSKHSGNTTKR